MTNRDVHFYPAFYSAQLFLSPWAEYAMLHLDVLFGGDRLVNLVEWVSMGGSAVGVSLIAEYLGAGQIGQIFAAVACATIPNGLLEASSAMNTYVVTFWIVVSIYYLLRWNKEPTWPIVWALGAAIGLAILTKGTAYILLPFVLLVCWWAGTASVRKKLFQRLPVLLLAILVLNGPLFVRNYKLSGSPLGFSTPLGDDPQRQYANGAFSVPITFANVVKNLALHVSTPSNAVNQHLSNFTSSMLRKLGIDLNDKESTYRGGFHFNGISSNEDRAGNPLQLALIVVSLCLLFSSRIGDRQLRLYVAGLICSFVLFCALVRWQGSNGRYHLPLFALGMSLAGVVFERALRRNFLVAIAWLLLISAIPFALFNSLRPLMPFRGITIFNESRTETYFADSHDYLMDSYISAAEAVKRMPCNSVGVDASLDDFDYPIFSLLGAGHGTRQIRYAEVRNLTSAYARSDTPAPCIIVCLRCANAPAKWAQYKAVGGKASVFGEVAVFGAEGTTPNTEIVALPSASEVQPLFDRLDRYRESPPTFDLALTEDKVQRASHDWPKKRAILKARLDDLYVAGLSLWRARDSVDPLRKKGEPIDHSKIDRLQLLAALEVTESWYQSEPRRVQELDDLSDELYSSWQTRLVSLPPASADSSTTGLVRIKIDQSENTDGTPMHVITEDVRSISPEQYSCIAKNVHPGDLLSEKPFGAFDSEAEALTHCGISGGHFHDAWAPARTHIASAILD
jgi:hypothetical protein